jgi:hypothetical protein
MIAPDHVNRLDSLRLTASQFFREPNSLSFSAVDSTLQWPHVYLEPAGCHVRGVVVVSGFFLNVILRPSNPPSDMLHEALTTSSRLLSPSWRVLSASSARKAIMDPGYGPCPPFIFWESSSVLLSHTWGTALDHFFAGNPPYYPEQDVTVPFYTAVAYSLGVELKSRKGRL